MQKKLKRNTKKLKKEKKLKMAKTIINKIKMKNSK